MAVALSIEVKGLAELERLFHRIRPDTNPAWVSRALVKGAQLVQRIAALEKILRSGPPGVVHPTKLTSRHGGEGLVGSIAVNRTSLPRSVSVGTHLFYGKIHELGGRFHPPRPFLTPALEDSADRIADIFEAELDRELRK